MELNALSPAPGAKKKSKRLGRGIGSGFGKTAGRGHKGQKSRSGGQVKPGFEGGQMPIQRRLPKFGFVSKKSLTRAEIRLSELNKIESEIVNLLTLKAAKLITNNVKDVKIIKSGNIEKSLKIEGVKVTQGARDAIEKAGGRVIDTE